MIPKKKPVKTECPQCTKTYGINTRKDGTIRCKLCGYEGKKGGGEK